MNDMSDSHLGNNQATNTIKQAKRYSFSVSPSLSNKLSLYLLLCRGNQIKQRKGEWITQAISEKLKKDSLSNVPPKETTINVAIDSEALGMIEARIAYIKKFRRSFSKKQWIVEAISEKLERDFENLRKP
jgi:hypothetical protein